ncbi:hypothetical protein B0T24DRAFT_237112 [Lasiosphaeria ovina]|uniref:Transmembrane protein n=1 Tax=Lasiosphaeria ovina TaxID=92902 RepID=A0AAE0NBD7_9PEZI|nr:hypothetical protein B0T24DRAFT_237112 [Lasiosphaeria ovina]
MASRWWSGGLLAFLLLALFFFVFAIQWKSPLTGTITRVPGGQQKPQFESTLALCHGGDPLQYERIRCSEFIDCFLVDTTELLKVDMAIGSGVVGLLPTILLLITMRPMDLVQLGLVAPHRAFAIACFSIGLPERLFSRLRPVRPKFWNFKGGEAKERLVEFVVSVPVVSVGGPYRLRVFASRVAADIVVLACAGIMLWRTWVVSLWVMAPWKCETPIIQFAWPIGCLFWVALMLPLLHLMTERIEFTNFRHDEIKYKWWEVLLLPYTLDHLQAWKDAGNTGVVVRLLRRLFLADSVATETKPPNHEPAGQHIERGLVAAERQIPRHSASSVPARIITTSTGFLEEDYDAHCIRIAIVMPQRLGLWSWFIYQSVIEVLGAALYFYGTFAWLSCVFLTAVPAIHFAGVTIACYVTIRITNSLF